MPVQKGQSGLFAKLGNKLKEAHEAHKNDETTYSEFGDLPSGIEGGVAQLVDCKFTQIKEGKQNAGQYMFYAAGVVKAPVEHDGMKVEGLRTQISEPMFDTPTRSRKTVSDHLAHVYNELRKLGVDTTQLEISQLESTAAQLKEAAPHFRFRTWKGERAKEGQYKDQEPRVQHQWNGLCEFSDNGDAAGAVDDNTPDAQASADEAPPVDDAGADDLDTLLTAAVGGDDGAQTRILAIASEVGVSEEDAANAPDWPAVLELINTAAGMVEGEGEATEAPSEPAITKGDVFRYKPIDPKTKKPFTDPKTKKERPGIDVEVLTVDAANRTATVKDLNKGSAIVDAKKKPLSISWDALEVV